MDVIMLTRVLNSVFSTFVSIFGPIYPRDMQNYDCIVEIYPLGIYFVNLYMI